MQQELTAAAGKEADAIRVGFVWRADRLVQIISLVSPAGEVIPLVESVEGSAADYWPPSPPLQSVSLQTLPDGGRAALLVGMAGRSHWSASIESLPDQAALLFDVACRTNDPTAALCSTYRLIMPGAASLFAAADRSWIEVGQSDRALVFTPVGDRAARPALTTRNDSSFAVIPEVPPNAATIRWKYQAQLLTSAF